MPERLLIELGCEELPARAVESLARQMAANLDRRLHGSGLAEGAGQAYWTPRRLIYCHPAVAAHEPVREEEVIGPPARIAFAADGSPTPQAKGFAAKNQASAEALFRLTTPKGEYAALRRKVGGEQSTALLGPAIVQAIHEIVLPKSMAWDGGGFRFLRPVRWLVALLGGEAIACTLGGLASAPVSRGHRTLGAASFPVSSAADFPALWQNNGVVPDALQRQRAMAQAVSAVLPAGMRLRGDAALETTLINLTEFPDAVRGDFDPAYLETLPPEVLVTVMRDHQKYYAVEDSAGALAPHFIAIINQRGDPEGLIRHGNERVLRARFSDARFFYEADLKLSLAARLPQLEQVTFHAQLGSYRDKSRRMALLASWLAGQWPGCDAAVAATAAELAKCDLTTEMVKEFPELQGIMGGRYARAAGQPAKVAEAIADQYLWETAPRSLAGAAVSLADKLDTIAGLFAIGEIPSGSADPFALRRQGNGVVRTVIERGLTLSLSAAIAQALSGYDKPEVPPELGPFFRERLAFYLTEAAGMTAPVVAAVLAAGSDDPLDALDRCRALASTPEAAAVAALVKRARNIVRKERWPESMPDPARLAAPAEQALYQAVAALPEGGAYAAQLRAVSALAEPMETFFNQVRVNDPDPALRANRLSLLAWAAARMSRVADFEQWAAAAEAPAAG
ncbi:MAG: glycine--tRNA ligase subunit beta [Terriglobales bacterium]